MPLITSPSGGAPMRQIDRYGIELDVCPTTGGVWLDKGELDKLIALVREETLDEQSRHRRRGRHRDDDDRDDDDHRRGRRCSPISSISNPGDAIYSTFSGCGTDSLCAAYSNMANRIAAPEAVTHRDCARERLFA